MQSMGREHSGLCGQSERPTGGNIQSVFWGTVAGPV